jgi:hypothetical protein
VSPLFRRNTADSSTPTPEPEPVVIEKLGGKGRPTPKRREAQSRGRSLDPRPANRKEAERLSRDRARRERSEAREGMMRGEEKYLLPRDKGDAKRLARNIVDSRRNIGSYFTAVILVVTVLSTALPRQFQILFLLPVYFLLAVLVVDIWLISRRLKRTLNERLPDHNERLRSLYFYAGMRSLTFRRMRAPRPQVDIGDPV